MIVVFGTVCIDRLRRVPFLPKTGGYVEITEETDLLGGEAANTANALTAWGHEIQLTCHPLGDDTDGDSLRLLIAEHGLTASELRKPDGLPLRAPVCDVYITPDGERTMFGRGFSRLDEELSFDSNPFRAGEWFTAEPNMAESSREAARRAVHAGMKTYLMDFMRPDEQLPPGGFWQSSTDWAGHRGNTQRNVQWVKEFVGRTGSFTVLSDGPNGFVFGGPEFRVRHYPPFPANVVNDTTGAGDLFRAGMLHGMDLGWSIPECLRFASAAGCLKCEYLGGTTRVPTVAEIAEFIAANPEIAGVY